MDCPCFLALRGHAKMRVELIARGENEAPRPMSFEEASELRMGLKLAVLLWNENSYLVSIDPERFTVNGGRYLPFPYEGYTDPVLIIGRRHQQDVSVSGEHGEYRLSYLLGIEAMKDGKKVELLLVVSNDGKHYEWRTKR